MVEVVVAVAAVLSIGLGLLVAAFFRGSGSFVGNLAALALVTGGWFVFVVTVTGGLGRVF